VTFTLGQPKIDDLWQAIDYEVTWLHARWAIYLQLYGTSPERVDILNRSARTFAYVLQNVLVDDIQLGLAKLGDRAGSGGRTNVTLATLAEKMPDSGTLTDELCSLLDTYYAACKKVRKRRNKQIAHFDLETMLGSEASLPGPSRKEIEQALDALRRFMNCIALHFTGTETLYELIVLPGDGESLIATLKKGLRYSELVRNGTISRNDLHNSSWGKD
jgi:hypothetical protein